MTIRAVLFDWGGTLVRDDALVVGSPAGAVAKYARHRLSLALRDEVFESAFQAVLPPYDPSVTTDCPHIDWLITAAFEHLGWRLDAEDVRECARLFFTEATHRQAVFDDARALLASLRYRGYRTGVISNAIFPGAMFQPLAADLGLAGYLDAIITSADTGRSKPATEPYLTALAAIGVDAHEALFVGDTLETDVAGARAAGLRAVLLDRQGRHREGAGYLVIERLAALNEILGEGSVA